MALQYTTRTVGPVFYVSLHGTVNGPEVESTYRALLGACLRGGCTDMLVDALAADGDLSMLERFDFGKSVAEHNAAAEGVLGEAVRVAIVADPPLAHPTRFGELVALNRGARVKVANGVDEAFRWFGITADGDPAGEAIDDERVDDRSLVS
jgi:hypothetical protein